MYDKIHYKEKKKAGENFPRARNQEGNQSHSSETEAHQNAGVPKIGVLMTT